MKRLLAIAEILVIVVIAIAPLFAVFPYRINIFLSWEGAYRMSIGQLPYKDFGIPLGYMYWVIPAAFFKIFGAQLITLVKAQAFINLLSGFAFLSIAKSLKVQPGLRFLGVLLFSLSYSFLNYWPWYNHTVIVYELIGIAFLLKYLMGTQSNKQQLWLIPAGMFLFFSFFTKQDGGALGFLLCFALLFYNALTSKKWLPLLVFAGSAIITALLMILPFTKYGFGYWFNHGQPPHTSRVSIRDILQEFMTGSMWLKFYLFIIALLLMATIKNWKEYWRNRPQMIFSLLTLGILAEAAIFQVTSYVPADNNIFFHSFAFIFIFTLLAALLPIDFNQRKALIIGTAGVLLWWSHMFWKYFERFVFKGGGEQYTTTTYNGITYANTVNRNTYIVSLDTTDVPLSEWRIPKLKSFEKILVPGPTVDGIERLMAMPLVKNNKALKVLNMSELTPLAAEIPYSLETGDHYPLWFHQGVGMFEKQTEMFVDRIHKKHYDLVLYEYIPYANNFYPFKIREALLKDYKQVDVFPATRKPSSNSWIEIYVKE
ncbi:hypothetical protein HHL16_07610 [Pseudoflavitalea sp. G-6-1-2]|uniref:hypothetical protein n=1 Tax=Pseudoflavitalea sp. G-6-1-2 TaxID=2728841 RepID=UPI00146EEF02|nr:hypothetical protein [Pseudoflavitalea sp. G-6-1-2]NML20735.1 hypothetical protein [Pseudoflavitalea sp. G-6-1-2]